MSEPKDPLPLTAGMSRGESEPKASEGQPLGRIETARVPADQAIPGTPGSAGDRRAAPPVAQGPGRAAPPAPPRPGNSDGWGAGNLIRNGLVVVLLLAGGLGTWSAFASLAGAVIASGQLRVETKRQVVQHLDGGTVGAILVRDGDMVQEGQVLVTLDGSQLRAELTVLENQLYEVMARRARLAAEQFGEPDITFDQELLALADERPDVKRLVEGQRALFVLRIETLGREKSMLAERQTQIGEQITGAQAQLDATMRQSEIASEELETAQKLLEDGLIQRPRVLALEREVASLLGETGNLSSEIARLKGQIAEIGIDLLRMESSQREEAVTQLRDVEVRELELRERSIALKERLGRLEVRAPRSGIVQEMSVNTIGAVVRPADPMLFIVPTDSTLVVDARFEITARDQVNRGQETVLRFSAFNSRTTPEIFGTVTTVSTDAIRDEATGAFYYLAEVHITPEELARLGDVELVAGMPVEVYIQTGERSPFSYLMKPFADYFNKALRED